uniref:FAT domain-containing protein / phosphatidylinositol 3-and 4-kinase family protein n=1 Tax=Arundo donax TaxID=35708 RepID=A0A0A9D1M1_ARUDO
MRTTLSLPSELCLTSSATSALLLRRRCSHFLTLLLTYTVTFPILLPTSLRTPTPVPVSLLPCPFSIWTPLLMPQALCQCLAVGNSTQVHGHSRYSRRALLL